MNITFWDASSLSIYPSQCFMSAVATKISQIPRWPRFTSGINVSLMIRCHFQLVWVDLITSQGPLVLRRLSSIRGSYPKEPP